VVWLPAGGIGGDGESRWEYFRNVVAVPSIKKTGGALSFSNFQSGDLWLALITFLYVDFFDATGTLFSMANFINNFIPGDTSLTSLFPACCARIFLSRTCQYQFLCNHQF